MEWVNLSLQVPGTHIIGMCESCGVLTHCDVVKPVEWFIAW